MKQLRSTARILGVTALLLAVGCSWFSHRRSRDVEKPASEPSVAAAGAETEAMPSQAQAPALADNGANPTQAPAEVAKDFYDMHQRLGNSGLPDAGSMNAYNAFLCPHLSALIVDARERQQRFIAAHPDDKPPLIEGDLFSSLFEGPEALEAHDGQVSGNAARVQMAMEYRRDAKLTKWNDTVVLANENGIWCIDDVEYHGQWPFANHGKLSETLKAEF